jgi:tetratricopeptide (TPR) repeat protein
MWLHVDTAALSWSGTPMSKSLRSFSDGLKRLHRLPVVCVALLVCLGAGCSREATRDRHLKRANRYYDARQYQKAAIEYGNAFKLDPTNAFCVGRLAESYFEQGQISRALPLMMAAQKLDPKNIGVRTKLCRIYVDAHDLSNACYLAVEILEQEPANDEALLILAERPARTNTLAEAAASPNKLATFDLTQHIGKLRAQGGDRAVFHLVAGMENVRQKEWDQAEAAFQKAASLDPRSPVAHRALGTLYALRGDVAAAGLEHEKEVALAPRDLFARLRFAEFKARTGSVQEARGILEAVTKDTPDFVPAWSYLAALAFEEKRFTDCASLVARVLAQRPEDFRALLVRGRLSLAKTNVAQAIAELQRLKTYYDRVPLVHFNLALAYLATNDVGNALASLDQAVRLDPNYVDALFLKGQIHARKGDPAGAVAAFGQLARQSPKFLPAQFALAEAQRDRGEFDNALATYRRLATTLPTNPQPPFLMGVVYRRQKKDKEAEQALSRALAMAPGHVPALSHLVEMRIEQKDFESARKLVDGLLAQKPREAIGWLMLAKVHMASGDTTNAEAALLRTIELDTNSLTAYGNLARLYAASNRSAEALGKMDEALAKAPNNISALTLKAMLLSSVSNYSKAAESYEKILTLAPRFGLALNNLAYLYCEQIVKLDRAYELAARARDLAPDSPEVADTFAWILYRRGEYSRALGLLVEAAPKLPAQAEVQYHLGMAHYMQGGESEARAALQRALDLNKEFRGAGDARQRLAILAGDPSASDPQAMSQLEDRVAKQPDDVIALLRLADLQSRSGAAEKARATCEQALKVNPRLVQAAVRLAGLYAQKLNNRSKALELAKQARALAPNDPQLGAALGRLAFQAGDYLWAFGVLQDSAQKLPSQPDVFYDYAWSLYSIGHVAEAQQTLQHALKLSLPFTNADQARRFLSLTELPNNLAAAEQSASTIQAVLKSDPAHVPALMVLGALQTHQGNSKAARETYQKVLGHYPQFNPALKALVVLPEVPGREQEDYELALRARKAFPGDPEVAKALGRASYKRKDDATASRLLQEAVKSLPEDAEAHFYLGMAAYRLNNKAQARRELQRASQLGLQGDLALEASRVLAGQR